jgi:hypothetical protein
LACGCTKFILLIQSLKCFRLPNKWQMNGEWMLNGMWTENGKLQTLKHATSPQKHTVQLHARSILYRARTIQLPCRNHTMQKAHRTVQSMQDNFMQTLPPA